MIPFLQHKTKQQSSQAFKAQLGFEDELSQEAQAFFHEHPQCPLIGASLTQLKQKATKMSMLPYPILIRGESGTGKELFAKYIHQESQNPRNIVAINCGSIPAHLIYSELFGCTAHAFTGASQRNGLILKAHLSTLFLDEIGELPFEAQASLLRVLEQKELFALGSDQPKKVDFRLICATHRNLEQMVAQGLFREDLYHRISVLSLPIPPLRERSTDLSELVYRLNPNIAQRLTQGAWSALKQYAWPGNVRELKNTLIKLELECEQALIDQADILRLQAHPSSQSIGLLKVLDNHQSIQDLSLKEKIAQYIRQTFELHGKNVKQTAQALSISKNTVYRYIGIYEDTLDDTLPPRAINS